MLKGLLAVCGVIGKAIRGPGATPCTSDFQGHALIRGNAKHYRARSLGDQEDKGDGYEICRLAVTHRRIADIPFRLPRLCP